MQKYVQYIAVLFIAACIAACGGSGSTTTAATPIYDYVDPPQLSLAPASTHMGGSVQETPLVLSNTVSTLAGSPEISVLTDGSGTAARFNNPTDITTDGINFYVADYANYAIRQVTPSGVVTTLHCTTDGTTPASFNLPFSLTTDGTNIYVVDAGSNTIRFIDIATNIVTTVGSSEGLAGSVDVAVVSPATTADTTLARFNRPTGITTDGVNLYVADSGNNTIRRINIATKAVSTMAGTPGVIGSTDGFLRVALFNLPQRITTDRTSLYVTDFNNRTIRKINIQTGEVSTIAGKSGPIEPATDGIGSEARFNQPNGITTDGTYLYVTDSYLNTVRKIDKAFPYNVTTISIPNDSLHTPIGITTDGVSLFVADTYTVTRDPETYIDTYTYSNSIIRID